MGRLQWQGLLDVPSTHASPGGPKPRGTTAAPQPGAASTVIPASPASASIALAARPPPAPAALAALAVGVLDWFEFATAPLGSQGLGVKADSHMCVGGGNQECLADLRISTSRFQHATVGNGQQRPAEDHAKEDGWLSRVSPQFACPDSLVLTHA